MARQDEARSRPSAGARWARIGIACAAAAVYYLVAVTGEIGRTTSILLSAAPAAIVLVVFRWRPVVGIVLSAAGIVLTTWFAAHGVAVQSVAAQASASIAILGALLDEDRRVRDLGRLFTGFAAVAATVFVITRIPPNGSVDLALVLPFLALLLGPWLLARLLRRNSALARDLVDSTRSREAAERAVLLELERNRLARDVHDVVGHSLAVVIMQADGARFAAETRPDSVGPALDAIADTARRALGEVRTMLHELRSSTVGFAPGPRDLGALVAGVRELGVEVTESTRGEPAPIDRAAGVALYRIAQEALTNAIRHGDRSEPVDVEVEWGADRVSLTVVNAIGPTVASATEPEGQGVVGMRERADDVGGVCRAGAAPDGRYRVRAELPLSTGGATAEPPDEQRDLARA